MKYTNKKSKIIVIILFFIILFSSYTSLAYPSDKGKFISISSELEIHLLRVEHYLEAYSQKNIDSYYIKYVFPVDYSYQTPILLEVFNDTTDNLINYDIEDDRDGLNKIANFSLGPIKENEKQLIHFTCWVIVNNQDFSDLPTHVDFPNNDEIPEDTKIWNSPSVVVQSNNLLIKHKAKQLKDNNDNLIEYVNKIAPYIKEHRYWLFVIQLYLSLFISQDAVTTLFINGENVGRSHLACALLRTYNIPSRVLLVNNDQGFWTQMHYMVEYYCPGYGWVLIETTGGKTPYETKRQVINRICFPEDEADTKHDYIIPYMKGEERWIWINNENIFPDYVNCNEGSKSQMFSENIIKTDEFTVSYLFLLTRNVFHQYEKFLGLDMQGENLQVLQNAINYQKEAIKWLKEGSDVYEYMFFMEKAFDEYKNITIL